MAYKGKGLAQMSAAERAKRIAHLVATHNTSAVPTKFLTGSNAKYAQRRLLNAPVVPGDTMTNRDLAHEANAAMSVQYGPQEDQLAQARQQNVIQQGNVGDYYSQYLNLIKGASDAQNARTAATAAQVQGLGEAGQKAATSQDTSVLAKMQADAAQRGTSIDPKLAQMASQASGVNRTLSDAGATSSSLLGQAGANYLSSVLASGAQGRNQALAKVGQQATQLSQQGQALAREKGQANLEYRSKRRSEEATNVATSALAGVNAAAKSAAAQTAQTNAKTARERAAEAHRHNVAQENKPPSASEQKTAADLAFFKKHGYYPPTGAPKKPKGPKGPGGKDPAFLAPAGQQSVVQRVHKVAQYLNSDQKWPSGPRKGQSMTWNEKVNHLSNGLLEPQNIVDAAKSLAQNQRQGRTNTLGPSGASALHSAGAQVHGHFKYVSGKRKKS